MKKMLFTLACLLGLHVSLHAQSGTAIGWSNRPVLHEIPDTYKNESAVFVLEKRYIVYRTEMNHTFVYRTIHRIIKVLDDKGIEAFNRMTIASGGDRRIEQIQARTIAPGGKVYEVSMEEMKETKSEEGVPQYIFALKGLEPGAEVELLYTEKKGLSLFGSERFQFSIPVIRGEFTLISPVRLAFETKGYNGFPEAGDTMVDNKRRYEVSVRNIPALKDEKYSDYEAGLQRIDYRLGYLPEEKPNIRQFTWNDLVKQLHESYYTYTDKEKKAVNRFLSGIGINSSTPEDQKIRIIENAIKSQITVRNDLDEESGKECSRILDKKMASENGQARLFAACFTLAGVPHEIGLSTDGTERPLDEQFENWAGLEYFLFYLPGQKQYLFPSNSSYRMPVIPVTVLGNKGVFCKLTTLGNLSSAVSVIRTIEPLPSSQSNHNTEALVRFSEGLVPEVDLTQAYTGYSAINLRQAFVYLPKEKEKEVVAQLMDIAATPGDISNHRVRGKAFTNYHDGKPLIVQATVQAPGLMDKAGKKYLFKVGELIGRQAEMYQDEKRRLPISMGYPHVLSRTLSISVPEGYRITNPEVLVISKVYRNKEGNRTMAFTSNYKKEDRKLVVQVEEVYDQIRYPASEITPFRDVINAAADFNKIVLVMEQE